MLIKLSGYQTISTAESGFGRKDDQGREYKIDWGPGLRIHLAKDGLKIIILIGGGTKKRQQQDID